MKRNKSAKHLHVYIQLSDFNVSCRKISEILKIAPTEFSEKEKLWTLDSPLKSVSLKDHITFLFKKLRHVKKMEKLIPRRGRLVQAVVNVKPGDTTPLLGLSDEVVQKLAILGFTLDVDLYAWSSASWPGAKRKA